METWEYEIMLNNLQKALSAELRFGELSKARSGIYEDTPENRKLGRVGQHYGKEKSTGWETKRTQLKQELLPILAKKRITWDDLNFLRKKLLDVADYNHALTTESRYYRHKYTNAQLRISGHANGFNNRDTIISLPSGFKIKYYFCSTHWVLRKQAEKFIQFILHEDVQ